MLTLHIFKNQFYKFISKFRCSNVETGAVINIADSASTCADVTAAVSINGGDEDKSLMSSSSSSSKMSENGKSEMWGLLTILAVITAAIVVVVSVIILAVAFRRPMTNW